MAFGHVGDGNIHFNLTQPEGADTTAYLARWQEFNDIVHGVVRELHGSISAEHGVGRLKRDEITHYKSPIEIELMRRRQACPRSRQHHEPRQTRQPVGHPSAPKGAEMPKEDPSQRYTANLQGEVDSASLYRTLSQTEKNPELAQVYARLGAVEEAHAEFWKRKIGAIGQRVPSLRPSFRTRALAWLARRFGPAFVLPTHQHARADGQRHLRHAAGSRRRRAAGGRAIARPHHRGAGGAVARRVQRRDDRAAGGPPPRTGRQCAARRRARRE